MPKLVINKCYGGFGISESAQKDLGMKYAHDTIARDGVELIALIEEKGSEYVSGTCALLVIVEFPEPWYEIEEYDGMETVRVFESPIPKSYFF